MSHCNIIILTFVSLSNIIDSKGHFVQGGDFMLSRKIDEKILDLLKQTKKADKEKILAILQWENNKRLSQKCSSC